MSELLDILHEARSKKRGDEAEPHIADLYGCDRATWYRRHGYEPAPFSREKLAQFAIGLGYEAAVAQKMEDAGEIISLNESVEYWGLTGHPDIIWHRDLVPVWPDKIVIEVKTTDARNPKPEVSPHHAVQASAYALAVGADRCIVLVKHAGTHVETTYEFSPEGYREIIEKRAAEVLERTGPDAPMPPAEPSDLAPWGCRYCDWRMCERNPNYEEMAP